MVFKKVEPVDFKFEKEGDSIGGILINKKSKVGVNQAWVYTLENSDGMKNVWGCAILDSRMELVGVGSLIKITYKGEGDAKPGQNAPKIFDVELDDGKNE